MISAPSCLQEWAAEVRRRHFLLWTLEGLLLGALVLYWTHLAGPTDAGRLPGGAFPILAAAIWWGARWLWHTQRADRGAVHARLTIALDARLPVLQDSTGLLLEDAADLPPIARLQRQRVLRLIGDLPREVLHEALPGPRPHSLLLLAALAVLSLPVSQLLVRSAPWGDLPSPVVSTEGAVLDAAELQVQPPAYQKRKDFVVGGLDAQVPKGSRVRWVLRFSGTVPDAVELVFHDERRIPLTLSDNGFWRSPLRVAVAGAYRLHLEPQWDGDGQVHVISTVPDRPPVFAVASPAEGVTTLPAGAAPPFPLPLDVTATDDFGVKDLVAVTTLASGTGENVRFRERRLELDGQMDEGGLRRRGIASLDPTALEMEPGDELYVFFEARDNREPEANVSRSRTYIVRWPSEDALEMDALDVMTVRVMPEFFRSQRQIIIDTEALLAQESELDELSFANRSQAIAIDQKALRLRYGTFLGEEAVSDLAPGAVSALRDEAGEGDEGDADASRAQQGHYAGDGHDHSNDLVGLGSAASGPAFGQSASVIATYMHSHDEAEQATLFDPETRALLKASLAKMWDAELALRLAAPADALPFEYEALDLLKQVQQRSRIYLARVGFETAPLDEERRLTGERDGVESYAVSGAPTNAEDAGSEQIIHEALEALTPGGEPAWAPASDPRLVAVQDMLGSDEGTPSEQTLATLGALQAFVQQPSCGRCRKQAAAGLWSMLSVPRAPADARVIADDPLGRRYRERLSAGSAQIATSAEGGQ